MDFLSNLHFSQTVIISMGVFVADFIAGLSAGKRAGRSIKSSIMRQCFSEKVSNFLYYFSLSLAFFASSKAGINESGTLESLAAIIAFIPAVPEILSILENIKIIRSGIDTKPKDDNNTYS